VNVDGDYTQTTTGTLAIEIGGLAPASEYDQLVVSGDAVLDGIIDVSLIDGFIPLPGQQFQVLSAAAIIENGVVLGGAAASLFNLIVDESTLILEAVTTALLGDYNSDGAVDAADYVVWRTTDGTQEGYDTWRVNFGATVGSGSAGSSPAQTAAPEPNTLVFIWIVWGYNCMGHPSKRRRHLA
jgi:hypothetical protein